MLFNYNDCMKEGLLRKIPPSKDKATQSLKKAQEWLKEDAENALKSANEFFIAIEGLFKVIVK